MQTIRVVEKTRKDGSLRLNIQVGKPESKFDVLIVFQPTGLSARNATADNRAWQIEFLHAAAHDLENEQNPLPARAARVRQWLESIPPADLADDVLQTRTAELMALGFKNFDAFHLASAEAAGAEVFTTCDDRLQAAADRHATNLKVRVVNPVNLAQEVLP